MPDPQVELPPLPAGTRVEVCSRFDRSWARGFKVAEVVRGGYKLRRRSDDAILPVVFPFEDVRPEHRQGLWWA